MQKIFNKIGILFFMSCYTFIAHSMLMQQTKSALPKRSIAPSSIRNIKDQSSLTTRMQAQAYAGLQATQSRFQKAKESLRKNLQNIKAKWWPTAATPPTQPTIEIPQRIGYFVIEDFFNDDEFKQKILSDLYFMTIGLKFKRNSFYRPDYSAQAFTQWLEAENLTEQNLNDKKVLDSLLLKLFYLSEITKSEDRWFYRTDFSQNNFNQWLRSYIEKYQQEELEDLENEENNSDVTIKE